MNASLKLLAPLAAALAIAACNAGGSSNVPSSTNLPTSNLTTQSGATSSFAQHIPDWQREHLGKRACKDLDGGGRCFALQVTKGIAPNCSPSGGTCGLRPVDLQTRYGLGPYIGQGSGEIVALIEMGSMPTVLSDLANYRTTFGLGTANIQVFNQYGEQYNYPPSCADWGWCLETDLDVDMVSAACPNCTIYLIEGGNCGSFVCGIEGAEDTAVALGATITSNSWGCHTGVYGNNCGDPNFSTHFDTPGVAYLAASGDSGYNEIEYPAALTSVLAVGGTQIRKNGSTYTETVWNDAGAGCSTVTKPSWQHDPKCSGRTISDISAQAGLSPGVAVYDSQYSGDWIGVGGTSVATPLTAAIVGLAGNQSSIVGGSTFWKLSKKHKKADLNTISSGSDGVCGDYLCEAGLKKKHGGYKTYSGPAGWGTPNGLAAY